MIADIVRRLPRPLRTPLRVAGIHTGRHRGPRALPHGAVLDTLFVYCPTCQLETAATRHGDTLLCTELHQTGGAS